MSGNYYYEGDRLSNIIEPASGTGLTSLTSQTPGTYVNMNPYAAPASSLYGYRSDFGNARYKSDTNLLSWSSIGYRPRTTYRYGSLTSGTYYVYRKSSNNITYVINSSGSVVYTFAISALAVGPVALIFSIQGGGGGGGGANGTHDGSGGGGGGSAIGWAIVPTVSSYGSGLTISVGAAGSAGIGGTGSTGTDGGTGGVSYVYGSSTYYIRANGGVGGPEGYDNTTGGAGGTVSGTNLLDYTEGAQGGAARVDGGGVTGAGSISISQDHTLTYGVTNIGGTASYGGGGGASHNGRGGLGGGALGEGQIPLYGTGGGGGGGAYKWLDGKNGGAGLPGFFKIYY